MASGISWNTTIPVTPKSPDFEAAPLFVLHVPLHTTSVRVASQRSSRRILFLSISFAYSLSSASYASISRSLPFGVRSSLSLIL
ncbi:hypothetical protein M422DRAFT_32500 [Sphaerobolus stellatus SS14]|uniref:Unplaced genomic scaffold SPHSTscaffold_73, whole genome shotgun sequence n=1 Tax=Sphaerobolus stellatus (strain SS14) TaxID=990650 RepID=A0A0C9VP69_SPHS4|nr:hypothetical protein M422DRAFT_32500 [Sphaerobolus stellatus SS14]